MTSSQNEICDTSNYMKEYKVHKLLEENNLKKLKHWELYNNAYRQYEKSKIKTLKGVVFFNSGLSAQLNVKVGSIKKKFLITSWINFLFLLFRFGWPP